MLSADIREIVIFMLVIRSAIRDTDWRNLVKSDLILMIFYLFVNITVIMINGRQADNALSRTYQI